MLSPRPLLTRLTGRSRVANPEALTSEEGAAVQLSPRARAYQALVAAALLVPALLLAVIAWQDRVHLLRAAEEDVRRTVEIFHQHALNVVETHELIAEQIDERLQGLSWNEIGQSADLHRYLKQLDDQYPQVEAIWLIDPSGAVRNGSVAFPTPTSFSVTDCDEFATLRESNRGTFVGHLICAPVLGDASFTVVRRRTKQTGTFAGLIVIAAQPTYFTEFWRDAVRPRDIAAGLVRADGTILAREPELGPEIQALPPNARLRRALAAEHESGSFQAASGLDGVERLYAFRKVGHYPIFVTYGIGVDAVLQRWREDLVIDAGIFGLAVMALVLTALSALRRARQEELAVRRWQAAAAQVREEAERRLAAEEQLHQAQKMEALGQLTGSISHDFNNLLTAVIGNLEMLRGRQRDPHEERKVTDALLAAERGEKAIRSLLAFARRQPLQAEVFDLNAAVRGMETLCRQSIPSTVRLIFDLARDLRPVEADLNQTELAVLNLVVNARDAMPEGGTLRLTTANATLCGEPGGEPDGRVGEFVALAVADTGTGIPPEALARIFEPFFTTKPKGKGTGLGLSQVYGFARQSGGAVIVASEVGQGTTITLYLPTCMPAALRRGSAA